MAHQNRKDMTVPTSRKNIQSFAAVALIAGSLLSYGSTHSAADPSEEMVWVSFMSKSEVSQAQKEKIRPILEENASQRAGLMSELGVIQGQMPTLRQMQAAGPKMRKIVAATDIKLAAILTPPQMNTFVQIRDTMRDNMRAQAGMLPDAQPK